MSVDIYQIIIAIIPVLFAITVHEYAHGWAAKRYGDPTAYLSGRLTLNPINHIDPLGTIVVPLIGFIFGGFIFGWAKPVPVNFSNLRNYKSDSIKVSLAGPISNLLMAIGWSLICSFSILVSYFTKLPLGQGLFEMAKIGILINCILMIFNLLPIPPLDGGRVLQFTLPYKFSNHLKFLEDYGMFIILGLAFTGILNMITQPFVKGLVAILTIPAFEVINILKTLI